MKTSRTARTLGALGATAALALAATSAAPAHAASSAKGSGAASYGMTKAFYGGKALSFTYSKGYKCDTGIKAASTTGCEVGAAWNHAPSRQHDVLYITVPLGFTPKPMQDCPAGITCVDHPMTVDLTRLEPALKPLYPKLTDAQLTDALKDFMTPGHDHFITDTNHGKAEWWDVQVVGVTSSKTYDAIHSHQSFAYIQKLIKAKDKTVVGPIPSNIFLYFSVAAK
ncbi:hypothetical protein EV189_0166 [Motilibacter rhizosphaerae]|uniref:Uncharacterized protein n=1 Tax=Motilibacter rhizosphaerae TaxID=598652 RepID=A0A4Q7NUN8_9ACTN|nr:hypothetical protein [Motilibacter rhizosphaerae]RZS90936.1 hypothetical protein EV189_0166 [Motilibacter rhizosphaerae]